MLREAGVPSRIVSVGRGVLCVVDPEERGRTLARVSGSSKTSVGNVSAGRRAMTQSEEDERGHGACSVYTPRPLHAGHGADGALCTATGRVRKGAGVRAGQSLRASGLFSMHAARSRQGE